MGQIDRVLATRKDGRRGPHRDFKVRIQLTAVFYIVSAATARGMSVSAYLRRCGLAFAAHDLGLDVYEVLKDEPPTRFKYDGPANDRSEAGQGHGQWRIGGLT